MRQRLRYTSCGSTEPAGELRYLDLDLDLTLTLTLTDYPERKESENAAYSLVHYPYTYSLRHSHVLHQKQHQSIRPLT